MIFKVMSDYVNTKIAQMGKRIFAGEIAMNPYQLDGRSRLRLLSVPYGLRL